MTPPAPEARTPLELLANQLASDRLELIERCANHFEPDKFTPTIWELRMLADKYRELLGNGGPF